MSYSSALPTFPVNILVLQAASWFTPNELISLTTGLRTVLFPIVDQRASGFGMLASLIQRAPFALDPPVRFPASSAFATDYDFALTKLLSQLRTALSFKDRLLATSSTAVTDRAVTTLSPEYLAALASFQAALADLIQYTLTPTNYYDRLSFETTFNLTWS